MLRSEHVVRVRDAGTDGSKPYLVMDRLVGKDLAARTRQAGSLPMREAADYAGGHLFFIQDRRALPDIVEFLT